MTGPTAAIGLGFLLAAGCGGGGPPTECRTAEGYTCRILFFGLGFCGPP